MVSELNLSKKEKVTVVVMLCVIGILLIMLLLLTRGISRYKDQQKQLAEASPTPSFNIAANISPTATVSVGASASATETATATPTPTVTATEDPNRDLNSAKAVVTNFLKAYIDRDLAQAKPYMTDAFYGSFSQDSFAGVSSPSRDRYEIISALVVKQGYVYQVKVYLYYKLNGEDSNTDVIEFDVVKDDTRFLVSAMNINPS